MSEGKRLKLKKAGWCILWLILYGILFGMNVNKVVKAINLTTYTFILLIYLYKRRKLKHYRVAIPQIHKIPRGSVVSLAFLGSAILMNLLFSRENGSEFFSLGVYVGMLYTVFMEELFFRGYLLTTFFEDYKNQMKSILDSSALFGLLHIANLLEGGNIAYTVFQILCAVAVGVLLGILAITFDSILPGVALHWLINVSAMWVKALNIREYSIYLVILGIGVVLCLKKYNGGDSR